MAIRNPSALPVLFSEYPDFQFGDLTGDPAFRFSSATVQMDPLRQMEYRRLALGRMRAPPVQTVLPGRRYDSVIYLQRFTTPPGLGTHEITYDARVLAYSPDPTLGPEAAEATFLQGRGTLRFVVRPARPGELEQIGARYAARFKGQDAYAHELRCQDDYAHEALCVMDHPAVIPHLPELIAFPWRWGRTWLALDYYANNEEARALLRKAFATAGERERYRLLRVLADWKCDVDVVLLHKLSGSGYEMRHAVRRYAEQMGKRDYAAFLTD